MKKTLLGYYSHSTKIFNTAREVKEYEFISKLNNCFVIAPNIHLSFKKTSIYNQYILLIDIIDFMIVSAYNGVIGRGSYFEVKQALERGIPVYEICPVGIGFKLKIVVSADVLPASKISTYAKLTSTPIKNFLYK